MLPPTDGQRRFKAATCLCLVLLLLQGCASMTKNLVNNTPPDYQLSAASGEGLAIFSAQFLATGCPNEGLGAAAHMIIGRAGARRGDLIFLRSPLLEPAPEDPNRQIYIRRLKAGPWVLGNAGYASGVVSGTDNRTATIPFNIEAGQAYYLGEVTVTAEDCETLNVSVSNQRQRDMRWLASRISIAPGSIRDQLVQVVDVY